MAGWSLGQALWGRRPIRATATVAEEGLGSWASFSAGLGDFGQDPA